MPVELRKRSAPPPPPPAAKKRAPSQAKTEKVAPKENAAVPVEPVADVPKSGAPSPGDSITLDGFGGEIETNDGVKTTLAKLVSDSKAGVVLFTYPKARLFRESYEPLTATGLSIFGLSRDSPKANTSWKTKEELPYPLLSDATGSLITAIGFHKAPKNTTRGVFVVLKGGKILAAEAGGPDATVDTVRKVVASMAGGGEAKGVDDAKQRVEAENKKAADVAAEVADTAKKVDTYEGGERRGM